MLLTSESENHTFLNAFAVPISNGEIRLALFAFVAVVALPCKLPTNFGAVTLTGNVVSPFLPKITAVLIVVPLKNISSPYCLNCIFSSPLSQVSKDTYKLSLPSSPTIILNTSVSIAPSTKVKVLPSGAEFDTFLTTLLK